MTTSRRLFSARLLAAATAGPALSAAIARSDPSGAAQGSVLQAEVVQMPAWVERSGARAALRPGDALPQGAAIVTGVGGAVALRMPEGSALFMGERTHLAVDQLSARQVRGEWSMASLLRVFDGFVRYASTPLAKASGRRDLRVQLRTTTLGIRGTDVWAMTDAVHDAACLFEGRIELETERQGALVLDKPSDFWASFFDRPPAPVGVATPADLAKFMTTVALTPGAGLAVAQGQWRVEALAVADYRKAIARMVALRDSGFAAYVWERQRNARFSVEVRSLATEADAQAVLSKLRALGAIGPTEGEVSWLR